MGYTVNNRLIVIMLMLIFSSFLLPLNANSSSENGISFNEISVEIGREYEVVITNLNNTLYFSFIPDEPGVYNISYYIEDLTPYKISVSHEFLYEKVYYEPLLGRNITEFKQYSYGYTVLDGGENSTSSLSMIIFNSSKIKLKISIDGHKLLVRFKVEKKLSFATAESFGDNRVLNLTGLYGIKEYLFKIDNSPGFYNLTLIYKYSSPLFELRYSFLSIDKEMPYPTFLEVSLNSYNHKNVSSLIYKPYQNLYLYVKIKAKTPLDLIANFSLTKIPYTAISLGGYEYTFGEKGTKFLLLGLNYYDLYNIRLEWISGSNWTVSLKGFISGYYTSTLSYLKYSNDNSGIWHEYAEMRGIFLVKNEPFYSRDMYNYERKRIRIYGYQYKNENGSEILSSPGYFLSFYTFTTEEGNPIVPLFIEALPMEDKHPTNEFKVRLVVEKVGEIESLKNETFTLDYSHGLIYKVYRASMELGEIIRISARAKQYTGNGYVHINLKPNGLGAEHKVNDIFEDVNERRATASNELNALCEVVGLYKDNEYFFIVWGYNNATEIQINSYRIKSKIQLSDGEALIKFEDTSFITVEFEVNKDVPYEIEIDNFNRSNAYILFLDERGITPFVLGDTYLMEINHDDESLLLSALSKVDGKIFAVIICYGPLPLEFKLTIKENLESYSEGRMIGLIIGFAIGIAVGIVFYIILKHKKR